MNAKSKNEIAAKQELEQKYQKLREGKLTKEYKEIVNKPMKRLMLRTSILFERARCQVTELRL